MIPEYIKLEAKKELARRINLNDLDNEKIFNKIVDYANTPREDKEKEE
jgi:hypothetical protein